MEKKSLITDNTGGIEISELEAHDIDHLDDWEVAEFKYKFLQKNKAKEGR